MRFHTHKNRSGQEGFTLIETMIATAIFVVIMLIGIDALLAVNKSHKAANNLRVVMDSLSFVMEDMARNIRLGSAFQCPAGGLGSVGIETPVSCRLSGSGASTGIQASSSLALEGSGGAAGDITNQLVYVMWKDAGAANTDGYILKSTSGYDDPNLYPNSTSIYSRITPEGVHIDLVRSGFTVIGAESSDGQQPFVIIRLVGTTIYQNVVTPFDIQTSISPRNVDI